ncbi:MAG: bifunctional pyr operon transcriptional regulator/uracil phosphoribosyltransferase PyrR [Lentisphaerae bacterium]|nr:bifunctional pyr operon transcriptional regulator/uracil phosphoribosyltransferase PyrR [Lentisphaerota bacterium]
MSSYQQLFDAAQMNDAIGQLAGQIAASFCNTKRKFALVGIHQLGVPLAKKLHEHLVQAGYQADFGMLDITMYRDDIGTRKLLPMIHETVIPFDVNDLDIILVDDVLSTGRTIRAALDALTDYGRPGLIRLAVLVDRGEPEFPIRADFVGLNVTLPAERKVLVNFEDSSGLAAGIYDVNWNTK